MVLTDNANIVMSKRILRKAEDGSPSETVDECFRRVAKFVAQADAAYSNDPENDVRNTYDKFLRLLESLEFVPNSPTLVNAGTELGQLSACFVLPVEDSMSGIFDAVKNAALIHKTGGGTGFSFSRLRSSGSTVSSTVGIASGPVSFMGVFDKATETIKQGGTRRGANMGILHVDHPDIMEFINAKSDNTSLQNFNISVAATDEFMADSVFDNPKWKAIVENAWYTGDPGLIFIDRINNGKSNPVPSLGPIEATNPCGEQPLYPYDSCNLGSIDVSKFVSDNTFDYGRLNDAVADSVHFLDNVIDVNKYPLPEIEQVSKDIRRIGLGVMGWADALIHMGIKYDSKEAVDKAEELMSFFSQAADRASAQLALKRGTFPLWDGSIYAKDETRYRNSTRTTIAPTGTISIIAGCSSGIEPIFGLAFKRSHYVDDDPNKRKEMVDINAKYYTWLVDNCSSEEEVNEYVAKALSNEKHPNTPAEFITAGEIQPEWHIKHQAAFQKYTDNAVSKTINLPSSATVEDISNAYQMAYALGCKGITVYRDGSKNEQVLSFVKDEPRELLPDNKQRRLLPKTRESITHHFRIGDQSGYIIAGLYEDGNPGEVFIVANKVGTSVRGYLDSIGILTSFALQHGVSVEDLAIKLSGVRFEPSGLTGDADIPVATSIVDYVFRWLRRRFVDTDRHSEYTKSPSGNMCPECDGPLFYAEGCEQCQSCGYSKCG